MIPFSVLDLAPITAGADAGQAFRNSLDLARNAESWGFHRFWLAEHHNIPGIASATTAVVIAHVTDAEARRLFTSLQQQFPKLIRGHPGELQPPSEDGFCARQLAGSHPPQGEGAAPGNPRRRNHRHRPDLRPPRAAALG